MMAQAGQSVRAEAISILQVTAIRNKPTTCRRRLWATCRPHCATLVMVTARNLSPAVARIAARKRRLGTYMCKDLEIVGFAAPYGIFFRCTATRSRVRRIFSSTLVNIKSTVRLFIV